MHKRTFCFTQFGIPRKDDLFEVVFDPSPDKPEKRVLGPAPSKRSTGVRLAQPRRQLTAKLNHSIGHLRPRQFRNGLWGHSRPRLSSRAKLVSNYTRLN